MTDDDAHKDAVRAALVRSQEARKKVHDALMQRLTPFDLGDITLEDVGTLYGTTEVMALVNAYDLAEALEYLTTMLDQARKPRMHTMADTFELFRIHGLGREDSNDD